MNDNSRSIVLFTSISHAIVHTYELSIPILVAIWLIEFPVTTTTVGIIVSIGYALFGIGALPGGILADRLGSRKLIISCLAGMGLSFLLLSVAPGIITIAIALAAWGAAASVYHPSGLSLISTGVENRGSAFAYHGMAGNIGIAFGPLLTALLLILFDWRMTTRILVLPTVIAIGYAIMTEFNEAAAVDPDGGTEQLDPDTKANSLSKFINDSLELFTVAFTLAMVIMLVNGLFYRGILTFLPNVLDQFLPPVTDIVQLFDPDSPIAQEFDFPSYVYVGLLTIGIGGQYIGGKVSDRISSTTGLAIVFGGLVMVAIGFVPALSGGLIMVLLVSGLLGLLLFALQPLYQTMIAEHSPPDDRGLSYGYTYLMSFGIGGAGAAIAGFLLSVLSFSGTFIVLAVFPVLGSLFAIILQRRGRSTMDAEE